MSVSGSQTRYLSAIALFAGGLAFLALVASSMVLTGGRFEYPLDDAYIHLAMAEQLARGGYGVNPGEYAAASSSPLFSLLLVPLHGTGLHRFVPLFWNVVGLVASLWLWGRILSQAGYGRSATGVLLAVLAPLAINLVGVAFVGMEHALHVAASLAILSGLIRFAEDGKVDLLLVLGIFLSPLLRLEGLALVLLACGYVVLCGRWRMGVALIALGLVPVIGFSAWLMSLGLEPVPSSISAKLSVPGDESPGLMGYVAEKISRFSQSRHSWILIASCLACALLLPRRGFRLSRRGGILIIVLLAGCAHLLFGRFGWMERYEVYINATVLAGLFWAAARTPRLILLPLIPVVMAAALYLPRQLQIFPIAPRAVALQQVQMGRFVKEHWQAPVAVNDLGFVSWQNPNYVLDLWGLASYEARIARLSASDRLWVAKLAAQKNVEIAIIYPDWFPNQISDEWQLLGELTMSVNIAYLGGDKVSFFLTHSGDKTKALTALKAWSVDLPEQSKFEFTGDG